MDTTHLIRYVAMNCDRRELEKDKLGEVVPIPVRTTTLNSMTNPSGTAKETGGRSQFTPPARNPTEKEVRKLKEVQNQSGNGSNISRMVLKG